MLRIQAKYPHPNKDTFSSILGGVLREDFSKEEVDEWLSVVLKIKGCVVSSKNRATYDKKFITEMAVQDASCEFEQTPFDLQLADYYVKKFKNARERNIEFTLTLADLKKLLKKKTCYYTGQSLNFTGGENVFTLDRVDSKKGYTKENTVQCAGWVNRFKNEVFENTKSKTYITKENLFKILSKIEASI
jgi:hypothetical protein